MLFVEMVACLRHSHNNGISHDSLYEFMSQTVIPHWTGMLPSFIIIQKLPEKYDSMILLDLLQAPLLGSHIFDKCLGTSRVRQRAISALSKL